MIYYYIITLFLTLMPLELFRITELYFILPSFEIINLYYINIKNIRIPTIFIIIYCFLIDKIYYSHIGITFFIYIFIYIAVNYYRYIFFADTFQKVWAKFAILSTISSALKCAILFFISNNIPDLFNLLCCNLLMIFIYPLAHYMLDYLLLWQVKKS